MCLFWLVRSCNADVNLYLLLLQSRTQILKYRRDPECQNLNCLAKQIVKRQILYVNTKYKGHLSFLPITGKAGDRVQLWTHCYVDAD